MQSATGQHHLRWAVAVESQPVAVDLVDVEVDEPELGNRLTLADPASFAVPEELAQVLGGRPAWASEDRTVVCPSLPPCRFRSVVASTREGIHWSIFGTRHRGLHDSLWMELPEAGPVSVFRDLDADASRER